MWFKRSRGHYAVEYSAPTRLTTKEIELPAWSGSPCIKCGHHNIRKLFCPASYGSEHVMFKDDVVTRILVSWPEHFRLTCAGCEYSWKERCKDAKIPVHDA